MKKAVNVVLTALSVFLLATSSYALDNKTGKTEPAKVSLKYDNSPAERLAIRYEEGKERGSVISREGLYVPFISSTNTNKIHQPIVYKNFDVFSYEGIKEPFKSSALDLELPSILSGATQGRVIEIGMAFMTNFVLHEFGHAIVADYVGATGRDLNFFTKNNGQFFLGTSTVKEIDDKSRLPYSMGGEMVADLTFEHALQQYRKNPSLYNKSLLFFSGTDFLWYTAYAFYLSEGHPNFDPIAVSKETGISKNMLFSVALAKTILNAYRVYSGQDRIIPYFTVDKYSAMLNVSIMF